MAKKLMADKPINFHQSTKAIATSGQPDRTQFHVIAEDGYEAVVNLAMHDSDKALIDEGSLVTSLGMHYFHIPIPFDEPTAEHLEEFIGLMSILSKKQVWVHCAGNARVSAFMFHYLTKVLDIPEEKASSPLLNKWRPKMDPIWLEFMEITHDEIGL